MQQDLPITAVEVDDNQLSEKVKGPCTGFIIKPGAVERAIAPESCDPLRVKNGRKQHWVESASSGQG